MLWITSKDALQAKICLVHPAHGRLSHGHLHDRRGEVLIVNVVKPCRFRPTARPSVATLTRMTDPISAGAFSTRREMVSGKKGGVCWSHDALGGRPATGNQGQDLGVQGKRAGIPFSQESR